MKFACGLIENNPNFFCIAMDVFDSVEACELIGILLLRFIFHRKNKNTGLYTDNGIILLRKQATKKKD